MASLNTQYAKSIQGILKVVEIVSICVAFACLAAFDKVFFIRGDRYGPRFEFFMAVFVIAWVVVLLVYIIFLLGLEAKITVEKNWNIFLLIFHALFALLFVISSGLMADFLNDLYEARWHKISPFKKYARDLTGSVFFGFLSFVLFVVDAILAFTKVNKGGGQ